MIYLVSFGIFLVFVLCLAISLIFKRGGLKSESEAHAILEGITCAACTNSSCGFQGQKRKPSKNCLNDAAEKEEAAMAKTNIGFKEV